MSNGRVSWRVRVVLAGRVIPAEAGIHVGLRRATLRRGCGAQPRRVGGAKRNPPAPFSFFYSTPFVPHSWMNCRGECHTRPGEDATKLLPKGIADVGDHTGSPRRPKPTAKAISPFLLSDCCSGTRPHPGIGCRRAERLDGGLEVEVCCQTFGGELAQQFFSYGLFAPINKDRRWL